MGTLLTERHRTSGIIGTSIARHPAIIGTHTLKPPHLISGQRRGKVKVFQDAYSGQMLNRCRSKARHCHGMAWHGMACTGRGASQLAGYTRQKNKKKRRGYRESLWHGNVLDAYCFLCYRFRHILAARPLGDSIISVGPRLRYGQHMIYTGNRPRFALGLMVLVDS